MKKNNNNSLENLNDENKEESRVKDGNLSAPDGKKTAFYFALGAIIISAVTFILAFIPMPVSGGVYFLIASALCSLACAAFLNAQKRHGTFAACKAVRICAYVLFAAVMLFFIGAAIYAGLK